jgi:3-oxochol-4-en-24-oyl-CoA dehydrogenase
MRPKVKRVLIFSASHEEDKLPIAVTDEQLALQSSIREWAKRAAPIDIVRALEPTATGDPAEPDWLPAAGAPVSDGIYTADEAGPAGERWAGLAELGAFAAGLPAAAGGADGTTDDLAAALAQLTESLVPGPVLPTLLARLVLAASPGLQAASHHLPRIADGRHSVATALTPGEVTATPQPDGSLLLRGRCGPLLGGGTSTHLLIGATIANSPGGPADATATSAGLWVIVPAGLPGITLSGRSPVDFSRSLADASFADVRPGRAEILTDVGTDQVRDFAAVLFSVEAAAVANWCVRTAADYAAIRHQFGRAIGSFQAVKHLCARMLCRAETAAVLAWDAARAVDEVRAGLPLAAAAAAAIALDAAVDNAKDCIQVLGGIGFTWEHDAHLYLRRALALRQLLGGSAAWRDRAADLALAGARRSLALTDGPEVASAGNTDVAGGAGLAAIRTRLRGLATDWARLPADQQRRAMADSGYAAPEWPAPHGLAASPAERLIIDSELAAAGLSRPDIGIGGWAVPAILRHGTPAQRDRFAGPTLRGEITWCQLFSEPEAGSDLASLRTRAERVAQGEGWMLTGQKVWTSLARNADWAICLARTDSSVQKHKGLTFFVVDMSTPGIDIRPLREMTGRQMFNQVFLDQVHVPDDCVVGAPGDGWLVARTTLASERVAMGAGSSVGAAAEGLLDLAGRLGAAGDLVSRQRLGRLTAEGMAVSLLDLQAVMAQLSGNDPGPLAAVRKLVGVEHRQAVAEAALELSGPAGAATDADTSPVVHEFLLTRCLSIAGGTTQILLSVVAERLLGLPREEAR